MTGTQLHRTVAQRLGASRQRYTASRRKLVEALRRCGPVTMAELLAREPSLHQSTAYRSLAIFEQLGVVARLPAPLGSESRFELAEPYVAHHHHLVCSRCGVMHDYSLPDDVEAALDRAATHVAGFDVDCHRLDFVGTCRRCG